MKRFFSHFLRHQKGAAFIEFAMVFPFMFLLLFGGVEVARYILIVQKLEKAGYVLTDIVGQYSPATIPTTVGEISVSELQDNVFPHFTRLMGTFGNPDNQAVIMSSVIKTQNNGIRLRWRQVSPIGGNVGTITTIVDGSVNPGNTVGDSCGAALFDGPTTLLLADMTLGENMIVGEVFFHYKPIVGNLFGVSAATPSFTGGFSLKEKTIGRRIFLHPRNGELVDLPPAHPVQLDADGNPIFPCE